MDARVEKEVSEGRWMWMTVRECYGREFCYVGY